jgi:hypothetical protein
MVLGGAKSVLGTPSRVLGASKLLGRVELLPGQVSAGAGNTRSVQLDVTSYCRGRVRQKATP